MDDALRDLVDSSFSIWACVSGLRPGKLFDTTVAASVSAGMETVWS